MMRYRFGTVTEITELRRKISDCVTMIILLSSLLVVAPTFEEKLRAASESVEAQELDRANEQLKRLGRSIDSVSPAERAYFHRTRAYLAVRLAKLDVAIEAFERSIGVGGLDPEHAREVKANLFTLYFFTEKWSKANEFYKHRLTSNPFAVEAHIAHKLGRMDRALSNLTKAIQGKVSIGVGLPRAPVTPILRVQPIYPREASEQEVEGRVVVEFTIDERGTVKDPKILSAKPSGYFEEAVLKAVRKWKYKPVTIDGKATEYRAEPVTLEFAL